MKSLPPMKTSSRPSPLTSPTASGGLAHVHHFEGDEKHARLHLEQGLAFAREAGDRWEIAFSLNGLAVNQYNNPGVTWPCYITGHLAVVYLGHMVYGLDLAERKKLWEYDLFNPERHPIDVQTSQ